MHDMKSKIRKDLLMDLKKMMREDSHEPLKKGLKDKMAVKVVSDSPEGLEEGLDKAKSLAEKIKDGYLGAKLEDSMLGSEEMSDEDSEEEEASDEELKALLKHLK